MLGKDLEESRFEVNARWENEARMGYYSGEKREWPLGAQGV
jgi:hypothetical protein